MSRVLTPEGMAPYLYNPRNKRVMVATAEKAARLDEHDNPYFIPCDSVDGPKQTVEVSTGSDTSEPVISDVPDAEASKAEVKGSDDLLDIVMKSEDKDELVTIGTDLGVQVNKKMKIETMQSKISHRLAEMDVE